MAFIKVENEGYIIGVGQNQLKSGGISETEYNRISERINNKPTDPEHYQYKLRSDNLEWELVELSPVESAEEEAGPEDYEQALEEMGVNFNDEN